MSRDYLEEASSVIFQNKVSLSAKAESNPVHVVINLLNVLENAREEMQAMIRKAATYALGQIGHVETLEPLRGYFEIEQAPGVKDAMLAAMTAIKLAPDDASFSQIDRCKIIDDVYHGRRPADCW